MVAIDGSDQHGVPLINFFCRHKINHENLRGFLFVSSVTDYFEKAMRTREVAREIIRMDKQLFAGVRSLIIINQDYWIFYDVRDFINSSTILS